MLPARQNPFRAARIERLAYRLDEAGWTRLLARFDAAGARGLLVGPHGSGKTTLREELEARLAAAGWRVRTLVASDRQALAWSDLRACAADTADADQRTLLSIDGLDRLGTLAWWRLRRLVGGRGGLLATSHVAGRLPTLHEHRTSPTLLRELVAELLPPGATSPSARCDLLFARHRGDVRSCLRELYDDWSAGTFTKRTAHA